MKNHSDLNLGEVAYITIIYQIPDFWDDLLNGYDIWRHIAWQRKPAIAVKDE